MTSFHQSILVRPWRFNRQGAGIQEHWLDLVSGTDTSESRFCGFLAVRGSFLCILITFAIKQKIRTGPVSEEHCKVESELVCEEQVAEDPCSSQCSARTPRSPGSSLKKRSPRPHPRSHTALEQCVQEMDTQLHVTALLVNGHLEITLARILSGWLAR